MKTVVIIEDDIYASKRLITMLRQIYPDIEITAVIGSVESAKTFFRQDQRPNMVFMNVQLSDGICFDIFNDEKIELGCPMIFTTSYDEAVMDYLTSAGLHYLLKPIDPRELLKVYEIVLDMTKNSKKGTLYAIRKRIGKIKLKKTEVFK